MKLIYKSPAHTVTCLLLLAIYSCVPFAAQAEKVSEGKLIIEKWSQHHETVKTIQAEFLEWEFGRSTSTQPLVGGFGGGFIVVGNNAVAGQIPAQDAALARGDIIVGNLVFQEEEELVQGQQAGPMLGPLRVRTCKAFLRGDRWRFDEHGPQVTMWGQLAESNFVDTDNGIDQIRFWSWDKQPPSATKTSVEQVKKQIALLSSEYPWLLLYRPQLHPTLRARLASFELTELRVEFNGHECICLQSPLISPERGEFYRAWFAPELDFQLVAFEEWEGTAANKRMTFEYEKNPAEGPLWIPRRWKYEEYGFNAENPLEPLVRNRLEAKVLSVQFNVEIPDEKIDFQFPKGTTIFMGNQPMFW